MAAVVITTNEPKRIRNLFSDKVEIPMGFDMMLYTESGPIGIERKHVPDDFLGSVQDGRLNREIQAMRQETQVQIVLLHGRMYFDRSGALRTWRRRPQRYNQGKPWTRKGITNLKRTLQYVEGVYIEEAVNNADLVQVVSDLQTYFDQKYHLSIKSRPKIETNWLVPTKGERVVYFYSGLPGIATIGAKKFYEHFPCPLDLFGASIEQIMEIRGIGKSTATAIYNFLRGIQE